MNIEIELSIAWYVAAARVWPDSDCRLRIDIEKLGKDFEIFILPFSEKER